MPLSDPRDEIDAILHALSNHRRRMVIRALTGNGTMTVSDLATCLAATELDKSINAITAQDRKSVYVTLYQDHLPTLDAANIIDYNPDRKTLTQGPEYQCVREVLRTIDERPES